MIENITWVNHAITNSRFQLTDLQRIIFTDFATYFDEGRHSVNLFGIIDVTIYNNTSNPEIMATLYHNDYDKSSVFDYVYMAILADSIKTYTHNKIMHVQLHQYTKPMMYTSIDTCIHTLYESIVEKSSRAYNAISSLENEIRSKYA